METLLSLNEQLAAAIAQKAAADIRILELNARIETHPDTVAAAAAEKTSKVKKIISILKKRKGASVRIIDALDAIESGFDTVPMFVEFPIRLETKYYMPDADGQVSAIFYKWKGVPVFAYDLEFNGIWGNQRDQLDFGFTRERFDAGWYGEFKKFPKELALFLPSKDIAMASLGEVGTGDVNALTFLKVVAYFETKFGSEDEIVLGFSKRLLPHFICRNSSSDGKNEFLDHEDEDLSDETDD